jgi:hypothetical protein
MTGRGPAETSGGVRESGQPAAAAAPGPETPGTQIVDRYAPWRTHNDPLSSKNPPATSGHADDDGDMPHLCTSAGTWQLANKVTESTQRRPGQALDGYSLGVGTTVMDSIADNALYVVKLVLDSSKKWKEFPRFRVNG